MKTLTIAAVSLHHEKVCYPVPAYIFRFRTGGLCPEKIASYNSEAFLERVSNPDTLYIVNFWATWCIPCVKELPAFDIIHDLYKGQPVKVLLMSFDFKEQYPARLESWVKKEKTASRSDLVQREQPE